MPRVSHEDMAKRTLECEFPHVSSHKRDRMGALVEARQFIMVNAQPLI